MKIVIIGGPRTGKSTLARTFDIPVYCGDPISLVKDPEEGVTYLPNIKDWSVQSMHICNEWFSKDEGVFEGVAMVRALRKWAVLNDTMPCDKIIYLTETKVEQSKGQISMMKGIKTVWEEIKDFYEPITEYKINVKPISEILKDKRNGNNN